MLSTSLDVIIAAMPKQESLTIDPQAAKFWENGEYYSSDAYYSQRKADIYKLLVHLEGLPLGEHIPTKAVAYILGFSAIMHRRFALLSHEASQTMADKEQIILVHQEEIEEQLDEKNPVINALKTITLSVDHKGVRGYFLVSGLGDFRIDPAAKRDLAPHIKKILKAEGNPMNGRIRVNPPEFNSTHRLGINPGIVGPFADFRMFEDGGLDGILLYRPSVLQGYTAIAASPTDTLIADEHALVGTLMGWQGDIPFRLVDGRFPATREEPVGSRR